MSTTSIYISSGTYQLIQWDGWAGSQTEARGRQPQRLTIHRPSCRSRARAARRSSPLSPRSLSPAGSPCSHSVASLDLPLISRRDHARGRARDLPDAQPTGLWTHCPRPSWPFVGTSKCTAVAAPRRRPLWSSLAARRSRCLMTFIGDTVEQLLVGRVDGCAAHGMRVYMPEVGPEQLNPWA